MKKVCLFLLAVVMCGCHKQVTTTTPATPQPLEASARDVVATVKGYLDSAKSKHSECPADTQSAQCQLLAKGTAAKDVLIDALKVYCGFSSPEEVTCNPQSDQASKLAAALSGMNQIMPDIEALK